MLMTLAPGEVFQHSHVEVSFTTLIEGDVHMEIAGTRTPLVVRQKVWVPAQASHVLINVGTSPAVVECGH